MDPQEAFVTRLRRHRERREIPLDDIAAKIRVKRELLEAFECSDLSEWPRGLYARAWVRAYAGLVGLDPSDTVDEFCRLFPHGNRRVSATLHEMAAIVAHDSEYRDEFGAVEDRRRGSPSAPLPEPWYAAGVRRVQALWWRAVLTVRPAPRLKRTPRTS